MIWSILTLWGQVYNGGGQLLDKAKIRINCSGRLQPKHHGQFQETSWFWNILFSGMSYLLESPHYSFIHRALGAWTSHPKPRIFFLARFHKVPSTDAEKAKALGNLRAAIKRTNAALGTKHTYGSLDRDWLDWFRTGVEPSPWDDAWFAAVNIKHGWYNERTRTYACPVMCDLLDALDDFDAVDDANWD